MLFIHQFIALFIELNYIDSIFLVVKPFSCTNNNITRDQPKCVGIDGFIVSERQIT